MRKLTRNALLAAGAIGVAATGMSLASAPAMSHHSFAMYTDLYTFSFVGVVTGLNPDNNHQVITFAVVNEDRNGAVTTEAGAPVLWNVEMGGASGSANQGVTAAAFASGTGISVALFPLRSAVNVSPLTSGSGGGDMTGDLFKCDHVFNEALGRNVPVWPEPGQFCDTTENHQTFFGPDDATLPEDAVEWIVLARAGEIERVGGEGGEEIPEGSVNAE
jgi:hypothetical protein